MKTKRSEEKQCGKSNSNLDLPQEKCVVKTHHQILDKLIESIDDIDLAIKGGVKKVTNRHLMILVCEQELSLDKKHNWGLAKKYNFIYAFNGEFWDVLEKEDVEYFLGKAAEKCGVEKFTARFYVFKKNLVSQFISVARLPKPIEERNEVLINLENGTYFFGSDGSRGLREFRRDDFLVYKLPFPYSSEAKCPTFNAFLNRVVPDKELQLILAEFIGYVFVKTSRLKLEKALLLYGTGANGKSVFFDIIYALLGGVNVAAFSLNSLTSESGYYRAMLANKLVNYGSELNGVREMAFFKQLASGEKIEARLPYGEPFLIEDYAKLIFNCNELPKEIEFTKAYFRRFLIIPFTQAIPAEEQDPQLADKIISGELSGVFNWMLEGLDRIIQNKRFTFSRESSSVLINYQEQSDNVRLFLEDQNYKKHASICVALKHIYGEYREFCMESGYKPLNSLNFSKRLEGAEILVERKNIGKVVYIEKLDRTDEEDKDSTLFSEAALLTLSSL